MKKNIKIAILCRKFYWGLKSALCIVVVILTSLGVEESELNFQLADTRARYFRIASKDMWKGLCKKPWPLKKFGTWPKLIWKIIKINSYHLSNTNWSVINVFPNLYLHPIKGNRGKQDKHGCIFQKLHISIRWKKKPKIVV